MKIDEGRSGKDGEGRNGKNRGGQEGEDEEAENAGEGGGAESFWKKGAIFSLVKFLFSNGVYFRVKFNFCRGYYERRGEPAFGFEKKKPFQPFCQLVGRRQPFL